MQTTFSDGVVLLRPFEAADICALHTAARESVETVGRWLPWCHAAYSMEDARAWVSYCQQAWQDNREYPFAMLDGASGEFIGGAGINQINRTHRIGNIGYWVRSSGQGRGDASRAVTLLARFGFEQLRLQRLEIVALINNLASRRTAERAGAVFECFARKRLLVGEHSQDAAIYALVREDAKGHNSAQNP